MADLIPLTGPEVQRLLVHLLWSDVPTAQEVLRWSRWRRKHQHRAKRCHYNKRSTDGR